MKLPKLSFEPTYHELVQSIEGPAWRPEYNPARACVQKERAKIEAEGGRVLNRLWTPVKTARKRKNPLLSSFIALALANVLGYMLLRVLCPEWLYAQPDWRAMLAGIGAGVFMMVGVFLLKRLVFDKVLTQDQTSRV